MAEDFGELGDIAKSGAMYGAGIGIGASVSNGITIPAIVTGAGYFMDNDTVAEVGVGMGVANLIGLGSAPKHGQTTGNTGEM